MQKLNETACECAQVCAPVRSFGGPWTVRNVSCMFFLCLRKGVFARCFKQRLSGMCALPRSDFYQSFIPARHLVCDYLINLIFLVFLKAFKTAVIDFFDVIGGKWNKQTAENLISSLQKTLLQNLFCFSEASRLRATSAFILSLFFGKLTNAINIYFVFLSVLVSTNSWGEYFTHNALKIGENRESTGAQS